MSESVILRHILPALKMGPEVIIGPGDDAAVSHWDHADLVVSTDMLVEGEDFLLRWSNAHEIGRKAMAQNLADIAAMGARPTQVVVATAVPRDIDVEWLSELSRGMREYTEKWGVSIVGGDLSAAPQVVISVSVFGTLSGTAAVTRTGARSGDYIALAGPAGVSGAGLSLLRSGVGSPGIHVDDSLEALVRQAINWHCAPEPPISLGVAAAKAGATSMIDTSDGLWEDAGRVALSSSQHQGVPLAFNFNSAFLAHDLHALAPLARYLQVDPFQWILGGGEDHSLLATFRAGTAVPAGFRVVGQVVAVPAHDVVDHVLLDGVSREVSMFDHFAK